MNRLLADVHDVLASEPAITDIAWHEESELRKPEPVSFRTPVDGERSRHCQIMTASQNVLFVGASPPDDEYEDPPGVGIARLIERSLRERGCSPDEIDNWRDCGWSVAVAIGDGQFEVALAATTAADLWMLQIACTNEPGLIARLFGKRSIDRSGDVYQVAVAVHEALREHGYTDLRWRLDGYPDDGQSTPEPPRPSEKTA